MFLSSAELKILNTTSCPNSKLSSKLSDTFTVEAFLSGKMQVSMLSTVKLLPFSRSMSHKTSHQPVSQNQRVGTSDDLDS